MKFKEMRFENVSERTKFLDAFFPDREKLVGNSYQVQDQALVLVDGKKVLFLMGTDES